MPLGRSITRWAEREPPSCRVNATAASALTTNLGAVCRLVGIVIRCPRVGRHVDAVPVSWTGATRIWRFKEAVRRSERPGLVPSKAGSRYLDRRSVVVRSGASIGSGSWSTKMELLLRTKSDAATRTLLEALLSRRVWAAYANSWNMLLIAMM